MSNAKDYLQHHRMQLEVVGPVFVGSGAKILKRECLPIIKGGQIISVGILDIVKVYNLMAKLGKQKEYEDFLSGNRDTFFHEWLKHNKLTDKFDKIKACVKYTLDVNREENDTGTSDFKDIRDIMGFVKDPYGKPYIPGSSIKGMLRTILMGAEILQNPGKYKRYTSIVQDILRRAQDRDRNAKKDLERNIKEIENVRFRTLLRNEKRPKDAVNDIMSGFIVSDSEPLSVEALTLCQKYDVHKDESITSIPLLRECLKPGSTIEFDITIDKNLCNITAERLEKAVEIFAKNYYEKFVYAFESSVVFEKNYVLLGGGVGYPSKTVLYNMYEQREAVLNVEKTFRVCGGEASKKNRNDYNNHGISPHILKSTYYNGKLLQMGVCKLKKLGEK